MFISTERMETLRKLRQGELEANSRNIFFYTSLETPIWKRPFLTIRSIQNSDSKQLDYIVLTKTALRTWMKRL